MKSISKGDMVSFMLNRNCYTGKIIKISEEGKFKVLDYSNKKDLFWIEKKDIIESISKEEYRKNKQEHLVHLRI